MLSLSFAVLQLLPRTGPGWTFRLVRPCRRCPALRSGSVRGESKGGGAEIEGKAWRREEGGRQGGCREAGRQDSCRITKCP
eukprot:3090349-Pyramimonas_sp.AAC.1